MRLGSKQRAERLTSDRLEYEINTLNVVLLTPLVMNHCLKRIALWKELRTSSLIKTTVMAIAST